MAHLDTVNPEPLKPTSEPSQREAPPPPPVQVPGAPDQAPGTWYQEPFESREVRKAMSRADRAARRADRAARRLQEAQERAAGQRSGTRQFVDAVGDAATAALTAVSAAADEAQARLAEKARMRELEHAVVSARAGAAVDVTPPTRDEALKLADRVDPGSSGASLIRGLSFILAGTVAFVMMQIGGFGWLGLIVPVVILIAGGSLAARVQAADRSGKADHIQLELARASLGATDHGRREAFAKKERDAGPASRATSRSTTPATVAERPRLLENGDPRTRSEVLAVLDRVIEDVLAWVPATDVATLRRIRDSAARALPATDDPLDLTDHDTWLLRQICIDYVPGALDHYIALPSDLSSEPLLDGRSAQQVLEEQLAVIEGRLDGMVARSYQREAAPLLTHGRFLADSLRTDPFKARLAELVTSEGKAVPVAREQAGTHEAPAAPENAATREREHA